MLVVTCVGCTLSKPGRPFANRPKTEFYKTDIMSFYLSFTPAEAKLRNTIKKGNHGKFMGFESQVEKVKAFLFSVSFLVNVIPRPKLVMKGLTTRFNNHGEMISKNLIKTLDSGVNYIYKLQDFGDSYKSILESS